MRTTEILNESLAGRYVIDRLVGEGGMATVYLARDIKHDRHVALKVLKPELGAVLGVERFLSEIRVTANLQHPNLLPLFDSGEASGLLFYVMPFVEGESLRARLDREKQLPIDEAMRIAVAVTNALDYAHRHGVIHRDLKPENILLHEGQPVVADFGIALAVAKAGGARVTQTGLSLGTPQYMSPEQASGDRAIDARSDLYSLAAVIYEMIAGEPPHSGPTAQAIIAKLMTAEPQPLSRLRSSAPVHVEAAVGRALAKLPADRFSSAREFADALQGRGFTAATGAVGAQRGDLTTSALLRRPLVLALAVVAALALAAAMYEWMVARRQPAPETVRFDITLPSNMIGIGVTIGANVAVSPNGRDVAFISSGESATTRVLVRSLDEIVPRQLVGTDGALEPFFSPDGRWVGYWANNTIWKVAVDGGVPAAITQSASPSGLTWSPSGVIVASVANSLVTIPAAGGQMRVVAAPDTAAGDLYYTSPVALEDGNTVLFSTQGHGGSVSIRLDALSLATGKVTKLGVSGIYPLGVLDGMLVYATVAGALMGVPFDVAKLRTVGDPIALGPTVLVRPSGGADVALSWNGTLVFQSATVAAQLGYADMHGAFTPLLADLQQYAYPRFSPDGRRIALSVGTGSRTDVWVYDVASATPTRLTTEGTTNHRVEWSPDGARVLYRSDRGARSSMWWQPADLSGPAAPLLADNANDYYEAVITPNGQSLVYQVDNASATQADILYRSLSGDTTPKAVSASSFIEVQPRVSPDGRWVAYTTDASSSSQVVVRPFPGPGAQVQVSDRGGSEPVWSRDGRKIFYRDGQRFVVVTWSASPSFAVTGRTRLFDDPFVFALSPHANFDVSPDGSRLLVIKSAEVAKLVVVHGWISEMRARLPARR